MVSKSCLNAINFVVKLYILLYVVLLCLPLTNAVTVIDELKTKNLIDANGQKGSASAVLVSITSGVGQIPTEIGYLTECTNLSFISMISGTIPTEIGYLNKLISLNGLSYKSKMVGTLPSELTLLTGLISWNLGDCNYHGVIPTSVNNLSALTYWYISNNKLSGTLPGNLFMGNIVKLHMRQNYEIRGTIPTEIGYWVSMTYWSGRGNKLDGTIPTQVGFLTNCKLFALYDTKISGTIPTQFGLLTNLQQFWMYSMNLSGTVPSGIGYLPVLSLLYLDNHANMCADANSTMTISRCSIPCPYGSCSGPPVECVATIGPWSNDCPCGVDGARETASYVVTQPPSNGGNPCLDYERVAYSSQGTIYKDCPYLPCTNPTVDGGWTAFPTCVERCGQSSSYVYRSCTNPSPQDGVVNSVATPGKACTDPTNPNYDGSALTYKLCSSTLAACPAIPIDGGWSVATCDQCGTTSTYSVIRQCDNPPPGYGNTGNFTNPILVLGKQCTDVTNPNYDGGNFFISCPPTACATINGGWTAWVPFDSSGGCSTSCGTGIKRVRTCTNPSPSGGGSDCSGLDGGISVEYCNTNPCPVDGGWGKWSTCSATCSGGVRTRVCDSPVPQLNGKLCTDPTNRNTIGDNAVSVPCNTGIACPPVPTPVTAPTPIAPTPVIPPTPFTAPTPATNTTTTVAANTDGSGGTFIIMFLLIFVLIGGGSAFYYLKIYNKVKDVEARSSQMSGRSSGVSEGRKSFDMRKSSVVMKNVRRPSQGEDRGSNAKEARRKSLAALAQLEGTDEDHQEGKLRRMSSYAGKMSNQKAAAVARKKSIALMAYNKAIDSIDNDAEAGIVKNGLETTN